MGREFEVKFGLTEDQASQLLAYLNTEACGTLHMQTTYYDTKDSALSARHITLRKRMENGSPVCTVKTPISGFGRGEWETGCDDITAAVPELVRLGAPKEVEELAKPGLVPICGARFTRIYRTISCCEAQIELALDRGVLTGGNREAPLLEFEMELKSGTEGNALAAAEAFRLHYGLTAEPLSKFRRALALARGE